MKKLLTLITLLLIVGISITGCGERARAISEASAAVEIIPGRVDPTVAPSPIANQLITVASQKVLSLPLVREPLDIKGIIREDRWGPDLQKIWRFEHEFAQDIYQESGALTIRVKLTNISGETLPAQRVALISVNWINRQGEISSPGESVLLSAIVNPMDYPYPPIRPGQTIILEPFNRLAGQQVIQQLKSYEICLLAGPGGSNINDGLLGNFISGFYKETDSAKGKIAVVYKAGTVWDGNLKAYIASMSLNNPSAPVITGKIFFNWLDDKMNPLGKTEVREYSTRELPYYLLSTSELSGATSTFEFSTPPKSGAKSYEFWIEITDGK